MSFGQSSSASSFEDSCTEMPTTNCGASSSASASACASPKREARSIDGKRYKTKMCRTFMRQGHCPYGIRCMFAHAANEMRTTDENEREGLDTADAVKQRQRHMLDSQGAPCECPQCLFPGFAPIVPRGLEHLAVTHDATSTTCMCNECVNGPSSDNEMGISTTSMASSISFSPPPQMATTSPRPAIRIPFPTVAAPMMNTVPMMNTYQCQCGCGEMLPYPTANNDYYYGGDSSCVEYYGW